MNWKAMMRTKFPDDEILTEKLTGFSTRFWLTFDRFSTDFRPRTMTGLSTDKFWRTSTCFGLQFERILTQKVTKFDLQRLTNVRWFFDFKRTVSTPFSTWFRPRKITEMSTDEFWAFPTCFDLQKERIPGFKRREMTAEFCCVSLLWFWPLVELCGRATKFCDPTMSTKLWQMKRWLDPDLGPWSCETFYPRETPKISARIPPLDPV